MPNYDGKRVCAVRDHFGGVDCLWPMKRVKISVTGTLGQVDLHDAVDRMITDERSWNGVCGIKLERVINSKTSHINVTTGGIDGGGRTLAWSELPCGFTQQQWKQLTQKYDTGEMWVVADNPPGGKIDVVRVIIHETGHAIGISHINDGNLMAPRYDINIRWPKRGDIAEARARYGLPTNPTKPTDPPTPTDPDVPSIPGDETGWGSLIPCLIKYGGTLFNELSPEERRALVRTIINIWRNLRREDREALDIIVNKETKDANGNTDKYPILSD